jgi:HEAT repeat protein
MRGWALIIAGILPTAVFAQSPTSSRPTTSSAPAASVTGQQIQDNYELITGENTTQARRLGAGRLLAINTDAAVARLESVLSTSNDLAAQIAVCEAISTADLPPQRMLSGLIKRLGDSSANLGEAVNNAIRAYPPEAIVENVGPLARQEGAPLNRRLAAIACLAEAGDDIRAIQILADLLVGTTPTIQSAALSAFSSATGVRPASVDKAREWWISNESMTGAQWLAKVNKARRGQLRQVESQYSSLVRRVAMVSRETYLAMPEAQRAEKLLSFLKDELPALRSLGLELINNLITDRKDINSESKAQIVEMIGDPDPQVRLNAARIASELRLGGAYQRLTTRLEEESNPDVRAALAAAMGRMDDPAAIPNLMRRLDDDSSLVVGESVLAIGTLARKRPEGPATPGGLSDALLARFNRIADTDADLRFKFVQAMARISANEFLPLLRDQSQKGDLRARVAAIAGLSAYCSSIIAQDLRALLETSQPEIRVSAAEALGKCGRDREDLGALSKHLQIDGEADEGVRTQSWRSYLNICANFPSVDLIGIAEAFDSPSDKLAQQRRLDILKIVRNDPERFDQLDSSQRVLLLSQLALAQDQLGDFAASAGCYEQAADILGSRNHESGDLLAKCFKSRLRAHQDSKVIEQLSAISSHLVNGNDALLSTMGNLFAAEVAAQLEGTDDPAMIEQLQKLITQATPLLSPHGFGGQLKSLREQTSLRRAELIDHLLQVIATDPDAEAKLVVFGASEVIPRLIDRLKASSENISPGELEKLIGLGKRLAPRWKGFETDAEPDDREKSLDELRQSIAAPRSTVSRGHGD